MRARRTGPAAAGTGILALVCMWAGLAAGPTRAQAPGQTPCTLGPAACAPAAPLPFRDVPATYWAAPDIASMAGAGVLGGFPDGTFRPEEAVTRAQFAVMLGRFFAWTSASAPGPFSDVPADAWYAPAVAAAVAHGAILPERYGSALRPDEPTTRGELAGWLVGALANAGVPLPPGPYPTFTDVAAANPYASSIGQAAALGLVDGFPDGTFRPFGSATRAQAAAILVRAQRLPGAALPVRCPPGSMCPVRTGAPLLGGFMLGVNLRGEDLVPGLAVQPTGPALVQLMQRYGAQVVRLTPAPDMTPGGKLGERPWHALLDPLQPFAVILTLSGDPQARQTGRVGDAQAYVQSEESQIDAIRAEYGGALPRNVVALDVINEPVVDADTLPQLRQITSALRQYAGLPVTVGGWRTPDPQGGPDVFNRPDPRVIAELAPLVDFLAVHVYPDLQPGADRSSTDPGAYLPFVQGFLQAVASNAAGKPFFVEEFGAGNGLAPTPHGTWGSPAHQQAVVDAVLQALGTYRGRGALGGTLWQLAPPPWQACEGTALVCFGDPPQVLPALGDLVKHEEGSGS
jgi:hypothetical protein